MKTPEDEAFDELARKQGDWGGGFTAKRQAAMDKINSEFHEEYIKYRTAFPKEYTAPQPVQEPVAHIVQSNGKHSPLLTHMMNKRTTPPQPVQEPVAWMNKHGDCKSAVFREAEAGAKEEYNIPLYTNQTLEKNT